MTPGVGPFLSPGAWLAGFIKRTTIHCYIHCTKYESSGPCGFGEDFFLCFCHDAPAALAGFIKRTTIHCYTQNMKALGLVVSEKKIFLCFSHCKSMGARDNFGPQGNGWQDL